MNRKELFYHSVNVLQKAYFNGTLEHQNCYACAVGNLVAAGMGIGFEACDQDSIASHTVVWEGREGKYYTYKQNSYLPNSPTWFNEIRSRVNESSQYKFTGYERRECFQIEETFESAECDPDGFEGLCAVVDLLMQIHEFDKEEKDAIPAKEKLFNKEELVLIN